MATAVAAKKGPGTQEATYLWTGKDKAGKTVRAVKGSKSIPSKSSG
jgi:hypothetical protein